MRAHWEGAAHPSSFFGWASRGELGGQGASLQRFLGTLWSGLCHPPLANDQSRSECSWASVQLAGGL